MERKNDLAFTVKGKILVISEHQSTINPNMPLRGALYFGRTIEKLFAPKNLYKNKQIKIPAPEFYVFYNGTADQPLEQILRISDSYLENHDEPMLDLYVKVININLPAGHDILKKSHAVYEYSWLVQRVRDCMSMGESVELAIHHTISDCLREGIMVDFIQMYGSEVYNMLFEPFNIETAREVWTEEAREDGIAEGRAIGIAEGKALGIVEGKSLGIVEGETKLLIKQILKKLNSNKTLTEIANEVECDISLVQKIKNYAEEFVFDQDKILNRIISDNQ